MQHGLYGGGGDEGGDAVVETEGGSVGGPPGSPVIAAKPSVPVSPLPSVAVTGHAARWAPAMNMNVSAPQGRLSTDHTQEGQCFPKQPERRGTDKSRDGTGPNRFHERNTVAT